jgi:Putative addiction module component
MMESLWDSLYAQPENMQSPAWHSEVSKGREEEFRQGSDEVGLGFRKKTHAQWTLMATLKLLDNRVVTVILNRNLFAERTTC